MTSLPLTPAEQSSASLSPTQSRREKNSPILSLKEVNTFYGVIHILQNVSLDVYPGELVCLLGGNASGKSTTLKTILGIVKPKSGTVEFVGKQVQQTTTSHRVEH